MVPLRSMSVRTSRKGGCLQRLFSTFPSGRPGIGLLLLRLGLAGAAVAQGVAMTAAAPGQGDLRVCGLVLLMAGALLVFGFLTPVAAGSLTLIHASAAAGWIASGEGIPPMSVIALSAVVSAAVMLLGPGAFALDARLFGRREIRIERAKG